MLKIPNPSNEAEEIEVYTAAEVAERETAARTAVEGEYKPKLDDAHAKLTDAEKRATERAGEFAQFRKLSDDQVKALGVAERQIYENGLALEQERQKNAGFEKDRIETLKKTTVAAKVGKNEKLAAKILESWDIVNIAATTPEQVEQKTMAILGMFSTTEPDLVASVAGFGGGSFEPPKEKGSDGTAFGETAAGKAAAADLGLIIEPKK